MQTNRHGLNRTLIRLLITCCLSMTLAATTYAAGINLVWDANTESNLAGYNVYRSTQSGTFTSPALNGTQLVATTSYTDSTAQSGTYYYVVKAVNSLGQESGPSNQIQATATTQTQITNQAPVVSAGADRAVTLPATTTVSAVAVDDGLPNGTVAYSWRVLNGSGVTFGSPNSATTQVSFAGAGAYTLRITATDGLLSSTDDLVVSVSAAAQPLVPPTGPGINLVWDANTESNLAGYNVYRSTQSGTFTSLALNGTQLVATASYTDSTAQSGTYYYVVKAVNSSGQESGPSNQIQATVTTQTQITNQAPVVSAGSDRAVTLPATTTVSAVAVDDGLPNGTVAYSWRVVNGTGVTFGSPNSATTQVSFAGAGAYTLRVTATDGLLSSTDDVVVSVSAAAQPLVRPTGLVVRCSADAKTFTVSWNAVAGAESYYLRVDNTTNDTGTDVNGYKFVQGVDHYIDGYTKTTYTGAIIAGQDYIWWVHAASAASGIGPEAWGNNFNCTDATVPAVSITNPAGGSKVSGTVAVAATASDNIGVAGVQFRLNGAALGAEVTTAPYSTSWNTTTLANGSYVLTAVARDAAGNQTTSAPANVTVSNNLTQPTGLRTQCSTDSKTFTVSWNAVAGAENYYLRVDYSPNNNNEIWYITDGVDYSLDGYTKTSFTGSVIAGKNYTWWVHAATAATGVGPAATSTFICGDTIAPSVSITSPATGAVLAASNNITVAASASDNVGVVGVQFKLNGANLGAEDTTAPYQVSWNARKANGVYTLQAIARDAAGNQTTSPAVSVRISRNGGNAMNVVGANGTPWASSAASETIVGYGAQMQTGATSAGDTAIISLSNGENVVSEASVPASAPVRDARIYVDANKPVNTGIVLANDESEAASVSFFFTDTNGNDFGHGSFTLEAKHSISVFVNEEPFNLPVSMYGTMTIHSSVPVAVGAIRGTTNRRGEFLMTTLPVGSIGPQPGSSVVLPQFADGRGWATELILTNPTDARLTGNVQFFGQEPQGSATPLAIAVNGMTNSTFDYTIEPRSAVRFVTENTSKRVQVGYILATATGSTSTPQGLAIFSFSTDGTKVSETGVPATLPGTALRTYVEDVGPVHSGLALANPASTPATATLELTALDGSGTMTASAELPARGHLARYIEELFPAIPDGFQGTLRVVSTKPIAMTSLRIRTNERGDSVVSWIPVTNESSAVLPNSKFIIPLVLSGGGFSTEFIGK
jgi:hypothetical protein